MFDKLHVQMSAETFLDAIDAAVEAQDRAALAALGKVAFYRRNLSWQAAVRHADNFVVACLTGNETLREACEINARALVPAIRAS